MPSSTWTFSSAGLKPEVSRCTSTLLSSSLCLIVLQSLFLSNIEPKFSFSDDWGFIIQSFGKKESFMSWLFIVRELLILDSICFILSSKLSLACLKKSSLVFSSFNSSGGCLPCPAGVSGPASLGEASSPPLHLTGTVKVVHPALV